MKCLFGGSYEFVPRTPSPFRYNLQQTVIQWKDKFVLKVPSLPFLSTLLDSASRKLIISEGFSVYWALVKMTTAEYMRHVLCDFCFVICVVTFSEPGQLLICLCLCFTSKPKLSSQWIMSVTF